MKAADYVLAYDVTDDRERARVSKVLAGYGFRVQKSVFECRLTRGAREGLLRRIEGLHLETGFVACYALAPNAHRRFAGAGASPVFQPEASAFILDGTAVPGPGMAGAGGAPRGTAKRNGSDGGSVSGRGATGRGG